MCLEQFKFLDTFYMIFLNSRSGGGTGLFKYEEGHESLKLRQVKWLMYVQREIYNLGDFHQKFC